MEISSKLWKEMITHYPDCPTLKLQLSIADKEITIENFPEIKLLLKLIEIHEKEIRKLRKHISFKINQFESKVKNGAIKY
jgi:hypothetical protein